MEKITRIPALTLGLQPGAKSMELLLGGLPIEAFFSRCRLNDGCLGAFLEMSPWSLRGFSNSPKPWSAAFVTERGASALAFSGFRALFGHSGTVYIMNKPQNPILTFKAPHMMWSWSLFL